MKTGRKTAIVLIAALIFIFWGNAYAFAPGGPGEQLKTVLGDAQASNYPVLVIDGETVDLTSLLNSGVPLFNGQGSGVFAGSSAQINPQEKRLHIPLNNAVIGMQFLNATVSKNGDSLALDFSDAAQAALVITAPQVDVDDAQVELTTTGAGNERLSFIFSLENENGKTVIKNMHQVSFPDKTAQNIYLVNGTNTLSKDFVPSNLSAIPKTVPAVQSKKDMKLNADAIPSLTKMLQQAEKEGVAGFILSSTYRSYAYQSMLFSNKVKALNSEAEAARVVARPGTSEHQTGLAIDFSSGGAGLSDSFSQTTQGIWLGKNSWKYGFILRYPLEKTDVTKIIYEPWHFRYVGYPFSKIMYDRKLCLEEFTQGIEQYGFYAVSDESNTYLTAFNPEENKIYLSEAVPKTPGLN